MSDLHLAVTVVALVFSGIGFCFGLVWRRSDLVLLKMERQFDRMKIQKARSDLLSIVDDLDPGDSDDEDEEDV